MINKNSANTKPINRQKTREVLLKAWDVFYEMKKCEITGRREEVVEEVETIFTKVVNQHSYHLAAEFATFLQYYYSYVKDNSKTKKYTELALKYHELNHIENIVKIKFRLMAHKTNRAVSPDSRLVNELNEVCEDLKQYLKYDSASVWIFTYSLLNAKSALEDDFNTMILQSKKIISWLNVRKIDRTSHFYKDLAFALIRKGKYSEAKKSIELAIEKINKNSSSWSVFLYYRLIIEFHLGNYSEAYKIMIDAKKKKHINKAIIETWSIVKGYIKFLVLSGELSGSHRFKIGKFLNSFEVSTSDKSGRNINVIILRTILQLNSNRDKIIDDREAIKKYATRYLKEGSRARLFFKMLHQIVPGNFNKEQVEQRAKKYFELMPHQKGYNPDLEIIPFEVLWRLILSNLD